MDQTILCTEEAASAREQLARLLTGYWISQAVCTAARLDIADLLKDGPRSVEELAHDTGADPDALYRLLRALASIQVFAEGAGRLFSLTPVSEFLCRDVPGSKYAAALMLGREHYRAWGRLYYSIRTGRSAFERLYGMTVAEYLADDPDKERLFDDALIGLHGRETPAVLDACDFSGVRVLAAIGGGHGSHLAAILREHPEMQGVLFDRDEVVEEASDALRAAGVADRCRTVGGDFFQSVPDGADGYLLWHLLHGHDDEHATAILQSCRRAMSAETRLIAVESVIPPGDELSFGKFLDLTMLVMTGGRERTEEEFQRLFASAGLNLVRVIPTEAEVSVLEGRRA